MRMRIKNPAYSPALIQSIEVSFSLTKPRVILCDHRGEPWFTIGDCSYDWFERVMDMPDFSEESSEFNTE